MMPCGRSIIPTSPARSSAGNTLLSPSSVVPASWTSPRARRPANTNDPGGRSPLPSFERYSAHRTSPDLPAAHPLGRAVGHRHLVLLPLGASTSCTATGRTPPADAEPGRTVPGALLSRPAVRFAVAVRGHCTARSARARAGKHGRGCWPMSMSWTSWPAHGADPECR